MSRSDFDNFVDDLNGRAGGRVIILGRRAIQAFLGLSWTTLKRWEKCYHFPLRHGPGGRVFIVPWEAVQWMIEYDNLTKKANHDDR